MEFHDPANNNENLDRVLENLVDNGRYRLYDSENKPLEKKRLLEQTDCVIVKFA